MKILVVDFAASTGGAMTVLKEYYNKIKDDKKNEYVFLLSDHYIEATDNIKIILVPQYKKWLKRLYFDYFVGKHFVKKIQPDMVLSLQNTAIRGIKINQKLYVHQSIPFQNIKRFSFFKKKERKLAFIQYFMGHCIKSSIREANQIIVQTGWMKNAVIEKCHINSDKIKILTPTIDTVKESSKLKINNRKFFYPTSSEIYKNNELIYKAVKLLNDKEINDFEIELTIDGESTKCIKKIGKISREEVFQRYKESILIFPSYIETFGLPLLEAKEIGTIILASDTPFSHEILNDYDNVYFFNPFKTEELFELIKKCVTGKIKLDKKEK